MVLSHYYQSNDLKRDFSLKESTESTSQCLITFEVNIENSAETEQSMIFPQMFLFITEACGYTSENS